MNPYRGAMTLVWEQVVVDSREPRRLGRWWAEALGWEITYDTADEVEIRRHADAVPGLLFVAVRDTKSGKNRLHIDLRPDDQADEVDRLLLLGAERVDVGQADVSWVVLTDPEGNEFCVLHRSEPG
jgi:predicted enzyme related to lactoylglutathione lyase